MANSILTPSVIAKEALMAFKNATTFTKNADRQYSKEFAQTGAKIGNTVTIRKPARFTVRTGPALQVQNVVEEFTTLVLSNQKGVDFLFSTQDLTLSIDDFRERYIDQAIFALANQVDVDGLTMATNATFNNVGVPQTTPATALLYMQAQQKLNELDAPKDGNRSMLINPAAQPVIVDALKGLFQSSTEISEQYKTGKMGQGLGADWYMTQNIVNTTVGAQGGSPVITTNASQTGTTLLTTGWTASTTVLGVGDLFTIAGVYKVNPITKQSTNVLQQFVVGNTVTSGSGAGAASITISPSIIVSGPTQTVSASPGSGAVITVVGTGGYTCANNLLYDKRAFTLGCADMEMPEGVHFAARATDPESGLSIRIVRQYDINSDTIPCRLDLLYGWAALRPEWACRVLG